MLGGLPGASGLRKTPAAFRVNSTAVRRFTPEGEEDGKLPLTLFKPPLGLSFKPRFKPSEWTGVTGADVFEPFIESAGET